MQIIEVKNNLLKIGYEPSQEELILSGFLAIKDENQPQNQPQNLAFIGQIMHLEANGKGHFAIVKLLFNFSPDGVITNYNGAIPDIKSEVNYVETENLLGLLPAQNPIVIGELAQQKTILKLDGSIFKEKLVVCAEREDDKQLLVKNINAQLTNAGKKVLVFDLSGDFDFSQNKLTAGEDFKLPLNWQTINFIYEKGLDATTAETKALIQEVFLEVQEYVKTLSGGFIPFESFKNVVDEQYQELGIVELVLLKNKLLKYYEDGIFAQTKDQFEVLKHSLAHRETTILDLSRVEEKIQREVISHAYSIIAQSNQEVYVLVNVDNSNSDKKLLKQIYTTKTANSTVICSYAYKYLTELKQLAKDLILFAPINQQKDFASYNTFLNKLNPDEFIIYGQSTHNFPLIVKLDETPQNTFEQAGVQAEQNEEVLAELFEEDLLDEQIRQDVDQFYSPVGYEEPQQSCVEERFEEGLIQAPQGITNQPTEAQLEELTEKDLDFIDDLNMIQEELPEEAPEDFQVEVQPDSSDDFDDSFFEEIEPPVFEKEQQEEQQSEFKSEPQWQSPVEDEVKQSSSPFSGFPSHAPKTEPVEADILPMSEAYISSVPPGIPVYPAQTEEDTSFTSDSLEQGDTVVHAKYGKGTVEKMISYGSKTLCSIHFDNLGRRLLDPSLAEIKKVSE